jgi:hypothetical protein
MTTPTERTTIAPNDQPTRAERRPVRGKLRLRGQLFLLFCVLAAVNGIIIQLSLAETSVWSVLHGIFMEYKGLILFFYSILFLPVVVAYTTDHPKRHSFWWKCALSCAFPPAFFYLMVAAQPKPETTKVQKSSTGDQSDFIAVSE